ncbi:MAG: GGDEF domain-containing protein [Deltaproteobacteria bacterium]|nr:MAG: GGDEF domain-containing protein [Deltaproteobacteria bacterium]
MGKDTKPTQITAAVRRSDAEAGAEVHDNACLVMIVGKEIGKRFSLDQPKQVIGRAPRCDIFIDDGSISRQHSVVKRTASGYVCEDLDSTNGTMVDDDFIESVPLRDGALIRVGRTVLKFLSGANLENEYYAEIYRLTTTDGLTQAYNKRYFMEHMEREMARSLRYGRQLAVVMADIDHFKNLNDTWGHLAGDAVLRTFSERVQRVIRRSDTLARYGGEEFAIVAPESTLASAAKMSEKVRQAISLEPFIVDGEEITVTASFGVADIAEYLVCYPGGPDAARREVPRPNLLVQLADKKLYRAKAAGRNRVVS